MVHSACRRGRRAVLGGAILLPPPRFSIAMRSIAGRTRCGGSQWPRGKPIKPRVRMTAADRRASGRDGRPHCPLPLWSDAWRVRRRGFPTLAPCLRAAPGAAGLAPDARFFGIRPRIAKRSGLCASLTSCQLESSARARGTHHLARGLFPPLAAVGPRLLRTGPAERPRFGGGNGETIAFLPASAILPGCGIRFRAPHDGTHRRRPFVGIGGKRAHHGGADGEREEGYCEPGYGHVTHPAGPLSA